MNINLDSILKRASELRIAVVGDLILDRYIIGDVDRISPEAPVPVVHVTSTRENKGGAGNVVENLIGLGCQVSFFHQPNPPIKTRVMSGNHHIIRIDDEDEPVWMSYDDYDMGLDYGVTYNKFDVVVISDYGKGSISRDVTSKLIRACNKNNIPTVVDTKHQLNLMHHATVVKCNNKEWQAYIKSSNVTVPSQYLHYKDVKNLVITAGHLGMSGHDADGHVHLTRTLSIDVCDTCGAGDTVTAILAIMVNRDDRPNMAAACELANIAASEVCRHPGVAPITKELLIKRFKELSL